MLSQTSCGPTVERIEIRPGLHLPRIIKGGWQLAKDHNATSRSGAVADMFAFVEAGIDAFDCGDVYAGVEELIGEFVTERRRKLGRPGGFDVLTKYIPDLEALDRLRRDDVEHAVDRSLARMHLEQLTSVQLAWWSLDSERYLEVVRWLDEIRAKGKIRCVSIVNFNTVAVRKVIETGVDIVTCQQQYSVLDSRPEKFLTDVCLARKIHLLAYGTLAGGFISRKWLGAREPSEPFENRSLRKYKLVIDDMGGWELFQEILRALAVVAQRHDVSIANVATRYVLEKPAVGAVILGARDRAHIDDNCRVFRFSLGEDDYRVLEPALQQRRMLAGDVWDLERDISGKHGRLMKRNLQAELGES